MDEYLEINRRTYDATADEFLHKQPQRQNSTQRLVDFFLGSFQQSSRLSILELGPGTGTASALLGEADCEVTAIEFSPKMAEVTQRMAPKARLIVDEFLMYDFVHETYDGILPLLSSTYSQMKTL